MLLGSHDHSHIECISQQSPSNYNLSDNDLDHSNHKHENKNIKGRLLAINSEETSGKIALLTYSMAL
jgi:hypothetical protein